MQEETKLIRIVEESGVEKTKAQQILEHFTFLLNTSSEWEAKAKAIKITDVSQTREMKMAREGRLALRDIRLDAEKLKKRLKESVIAEGKLIDSIYNSIEAVTKPLESYLMEQEKYAEILEKQRKDELKSTREMQLAPYKIDTSFYNLSEMPEETFNTLLESTKIAHEQKLEAAQKAEEQRIEAEKIAKEQLRLKQQEEERIRKENERLKAEAEEKEKQLEAQRKAAAAEQKRIEDEEKKKREALEAQAEKERKEAAKKLEAERMEKQRLEAELTAKKEAEEKAERERLAEIEKQKNEAEKLAKAPIKKQLTVWVDSFEAPPLSTHHELADTIFQKFESFKNWAKSEINKI